MHALFDAEVATSQAGLGRRGFDRLLAAAWLSMSACCVAGQPLSVEPVSADLRRARRCFEELAFAASILDFASRVGFVNVAVNRLVEYELDPPSAPGGDVWATPYETLARGAGDCEDFAITKFFLLVASGAPHQGVRLLYSRHHRHDLMAPAVPHMVTVARWPFADPWVLDCIDPLVVALSLRDDLEPVFSFDQSNIWPRVEPEPLPSGRSTINRWRATQARTRLQSQESPTDRRPACPISTEARLARSKACIERRRWTPPSTSTPQTLTYSGF